MHDAESVCDGVIGEGEDLVGAPLVKVGPPAEKIYFSKGLYVEVPVVESKRREGR